MNTLKNVAILILAGALALFAQTPGSSFTLTTSTSCAIPGLGVFSLCKQSTGGPVTFTDEGSPYAKINLAGTPGAIGATGPQGIQGLTGATGPAGKDGLAGATGPAGAQGIQGPTGTIGLTGPQGPAGSFSAPACVTLTADTKGNLVLTPVACK